MRRSGQTWAVGCALLWATAAPTAALGATVVADVSEHRVLREVAGHSDVESRLTASLLLVHVVHHALGAGALRPSTVVAVVPSPAGAPPKLKAAHLTVDELLQLLLLTADRTAAHSLALAVGPGLSAARTRMEATAMKLGLGVRVVSGTTEAPTAVDDGFRTSLGDLARLGLAVAAEPDLRRRLDLDGAPIADGQFIVRATRPLIATVPGRDTGRTTLALARRGELELLAAATGPDAHETAWAALTTALDRYDRHALIRQGQPVGPLIHVRGGIIPRFTAVAAEGFAITVRRDAAPSVTARLQLPRHVEAPIEVNESIGELVIERRDEVVAVVPLVAPRAIAPRHWLDAMR